MQKTRVINIVLFFMFMSTLVLCQLSNGDDCNDSGTDFWDGRCNLGKCAYGSANCTDCYPCTCQLDGTDWKCTQSGCLSENDYAIKRTKDGNSNVELLRNIKIGDFIFDGNVFTKVLTVEYGAKQCMMKISLNDNTFVTMTSNHLLYNVNNDLISAGSIQIGDKIFNDKIVSNIETDIQYSSTPYTFSGYLQVNGVKVSSYVHDKKLAQLSHDFLGVFRWCSQNINEVIVGKILQQISYQRYYKKFKQLLGEEIMENKFWFSMVGCISLPVIIADNLLSVVSTEQMAFITVLIGIMAIVPIIVLQKVKHM